MVCMDKSTKQKSNCHLKSIPNTSIVSMTNPFDPIALKKKVLVSGLDSIKKKLYLLFAENELLKAVPDGELFHTTLKIPLNHESVDR